MLSSIEGRALVLLSSVFAVWPVLQRKGQYHCVFRTGAWDGLNPWGPNSCSYPSCGCVICKQDWGWGCIWLPAKWLQSRAEFPWKKEDTQSGFWVELTCKFNGAQYTIRYFENEGPGHSSQNQTLFYICTATLIASICNVKVTYLQVHSLHCSYSVLTLLLLDLIEVQLYE